jgi:hypothetical protein
VMAAASRQPTTTAFCVYFLAEVCG